MLWPPHSPSCSVSSSLLRPEPVSMRLRIGTRRSRLALAQTQEIAVRLGALGVDPEVVPFLTSGDRGAPGQASLYGRKGLFVEEIVAALQRGDVDLAVHSAKDLPSED